MGAKESCKKYNNDPVRLMDILLDIQADAGCITDADAQSVADAVGIAKVDVVQTRSFYHFFSETKRGDYTVYLNNSVVSEMMGCEEVAKSFEEAAGVKFDGVTDDGKIGLYYTSCIGMNDQEVAAIINGKVFTKLTADKAKALVADMKAGKSVEDMLGTAYGDGKNAEMKAIVNNNLMKKGEVIFSDYEVGAGLKAAKAKKPEEVIADIKAAGIRGRGGAGFPTGMKWEFCRAAKGDQHWVFCNADEGEPGTFKDRVLLTEMPEQVFEGMAIAGYAIGGTEGILYLRNEYMYMKEYLEGVLDKMKDILDGYKIRIQFGAGAYVCGEESALIESAEGKRGEPRDRPPFPVEKGYLEQPTSVNNVETLSSAVKVMVKGADWYSKLGSTDSKGTKVLSISGDCDKPGVYEVPWGISVKEMLDMVGAKDTLAVVAGGPSGSIIDAKQFDRKLGYTDLGTGGAMIVIGKDRDLLKIAHNFTEFFIDESCGSCVPCRALTLMYKTVLEKVQKGEAVKSDLDDMLSWEPFMKNNRCGLGQTAMNPIVTTIKNFREVYESKIKDSDPNFKMSFDLKTAVSDYDAVVGNK